jgi:hypothetical protein
VDASLRAKHDQAEGWTTDKSCENHSLECHERCRLVEDFKLPSAHPALFNYQAYVRASNRCCKIELDEVFCFRRYVKISIFTVGLELIKPLLRLRMNLFTKDEVEDRDAVEAVEYLSTSIPNQLFY